MAEAKVKPDGEITSMGGQNASVSPDLLQDGQYFRGVNIVSRGGKTATRPRFPKVELTGLSTLYTKNRFQGFGVFAQTGGDIMVMVCGGQVIGVNVNTWEVFDYQQTMNADVTRCYFGQPDKYFVVQDGRTLPVICNFDDVVTHARKAFRVANGQAVDEVPIGTVMAYVHGRLFVAIEQSGTDLFGNPQNVGSRFFQAGDFMLPTSPKTVLEFTETQYLNGGGAFALPNELGLIRGMQAMRNADTGSGWGELFVFAEHGVSRFAFEAPRAQWSSIDISRVAFTGAGTLSPYSIIPVNSDLMFRGTDGIRSILYTSSKIRENAGGLANEPMSAEVRDLLVDNRQQLQYVSSSYVDDRVLMTAYGATEGVQPYFKSMISLDGNVFSRMSEPSQPVYDGMWTGLKFLQVGAVKNATQELAVIAAIDENGDNALYYVDGDTLYDGAASRPLTRRYSRSFNFGSTIDLKRLHHIDLDLSELHGQVDVSVYYRPHSYPLWSSAGSMTINADVSGEEQKRTRRRFAAKNTRNSDNTDDLNTDVSYAFQFCIEITGKAKVEQLIAYAEVGETVTSLIGLRAGCNEGSDSVTLTAGGDAGLTLDDYSYSIG